MTLYQDIQTKIRNLKTEFGDIVVLALRWLDNRYPETRDAVRWLNEVLRGPKGDPLVLTSSSLSEDVPLVDQLQEKWTFTNPTILEGLVDKTNDSTLIERMSQYKKHFKYVRRSIPITDQEVILEPFNRDKPCLIVIFKNITFFDDIELFLQEVFEIYRRYLSIHMIKPGCVKVTLQFPASMEPYLQTCIDKKRVSVMHYADMHLIRDDDQTKTQAQTTSKKSAMNSGLPDKCSIHDLVPMEDDCHPFIELYYALLARTTSFDKCSIHDLVPTKEGDHLLYSTHMSSPRKSYIMFNI